MSHEDFDINSLATYLQLTREQVTKLAERGKLPGRRIAGQWRFARAEVHHWWEERIGQSGEAELAQLELVLQGPPSAEPDSSFTDDVDLAQMLKVEGIAIPLLAKTRNSAITAMVDLANQTGLLWDAEKMEDAVRTRENLHPTALDNGVALLHPRRPLGAILAEPFLALGLAPQGIPFGGSRSLTDVFFLICSTEDRGHLRTLARLSRILADSTFLIRLRSLTDPYEVQELVAEYERTLGT